ncbi:helix-turn-helix domain-containing protein [Rhodococcoides yunnanense]|uniref:helix-turn-helix domain-containing protein n=1 Tax=Rhodococcoides yunnanense TaxID=278209 RepID=UPI000933B362|nr:helix-turn-helix domain-containing protein [Rhodococcus yunnanensis]
MSENVTSPTRSIDRAMAVWHAVSDSPDGIGVKQLAEAVELNETTTYRIAQALVRGGLLGRDTDTLRYRTVTESIGSKSDTPPLPIDVLAPHLYAAASVLGITVSCVVPRNQTIEAVIVARPIERFCEDQLPEMRVHRESSPAAALFGPGGSTRKPGYEVTAGTLGRRIRGIAVPVFSECNVVAAVCVQGYEWCIPPQRQREIIVALKELADTLRTVLDAHSGVCR